MAAFKSWKLDFEGGEARRHVPDPPGFDSATGRELATTSGAAQSQQLLQMKQAALYSRATGQFKNLGMMAFMMWMSGSQIHLFSIMMTASGIYQPIMSIVNSGEAFPERDSDGGRLNTWLPRIIYCLINLAGLGFGLWKVNGMGLLPTHASDYVSAMTVPRAEFMSLPGRPI